MQLSTTLTLALVGVSSAYFHCPTVNETGFQPSCCYDIVGQVGIGCMSRKRKASMTCMNSD